MSDLTAAAYQSEMLCCNQGIPTVVDVTDLSSEVLSGAYRCVEHFEHMHECTRVIALRKAAVPLEMTAACAMMTSSLIKARTSLR